MYPTLLLLTLLSSFSCKHWRDSISTPGDKIPSMSEIESILGIEYEANDMMEEMMHSFTTNSFFLQESTNDCKERRDFSGPDIIQFLPQTKAVIHRLDEVVTFTNDCFKTNTARMTKQTNDSVTFSINSSEPRNFYCKDSYLFTTTKTQKVKVAFAKGEHEVTFKKLTADDMMEIRVNGMRIFGFCENIAESTVSIYKTIKFFIESQTHPHTPEEKKKRASYYKKKPQQEVELDHMEFLKKFAGMEIEHRGPMAQIPLPIEDSIQSGDFIGLTEVDSLVSTMIMYLSGGRISHAAIALRLEDNELYVAEMKMEGLIITKWKEFLDEQIFTHHFVVHCPLKKEYREKFDTKKAYAYFKSLGDLNYGNYTLLMPWFDVPDQSTAAYIPVENFNLFLGLVEKFSYDLIHTNFGAALNMRLGTKNLSIHEITLEANRRNMTFEELMAVPEEDDWRYDNGEHLICSPFVITMYREAGLFEGVEINAKEFQPKDIYLIDLFDKEFKRPAICDEVDPGLPYCQVLGTYRLHLDGYSTIPIYSHMFDKCPSVPPLYKLTDHC